MLQLDDDNLYTSPFKGVKAVFHFIMLFPESKILAEGKEDKHHVSIV